MLVDFFCFVLFFFLLLNIFSFIFDFTIFSVAYSDIPDDSIESSELDSDLEVNPLSFFGILKRKVYWKFFEKGKGHFNSYDEFKIHWNPKTSLRKEIKLWFRPLSNPQTDNKIKLMNNINNLRRKEYAYRVWRHNEMHRRK